MDASVFIDGVAAIATAAAVWVAVAGDRIRQTLYAPELRVSLLEDDGHFASDPDGAELLLFHLQVSNERPDCPAEACQAYLIGIEKLVDSGRYQSIPLPVPRPLAWAPREHQPLAITLVSEAQLDLAVLAPSGSALLPARGFMPWLLSYPRPFGGFLSAGESARYSIRIEARNLKRPILVTVQVMWDGGWQGRDTVAAGHLSVRRLAHE
jgi:hypothetical protein